MEINIFNQSLCSSIDGKKIMNLVKRILKEEKFKLSNLNIVIADDNHLKKLNRMFFKKNRTTNVISFNMEEVSEIYISFDQIKEHEELYYYIIHGLLHIIGYDHRNKAEGKVMRNKCLLYLSYV